MNDERVVLISLLGAAQQALELIYVISPFESDTTRRLEREIKAALEILEEKNSEGK